MKSRLVHINLSEVSVVCFVLLEKQRDPAQSACKMSTPEGKHLALASVFFDCFRREESMGARISRRGFLRTAGGTVVAIPLEATGSPAVEALHLAEHPTTVSAHLMIALSTSMSISMRTTLISYKTSDLGGADESHCLCLLRMFIAHKWQTQRQREKFLFAHILGRLRCLPFVSGCRSKGIMG